MSFNHSHSRKRGFTLIEMVVYVMLFAIFSTLVMGILIKMVHITYEFRLNRDLNATALVMLDSLTNEIRKADHIDLIQSDIGNSPGQLVLIQDDGGTTEYDFFVDAGRLKVAVDDVDQGYIGSQNVTINLLVFNHVATTNSEGVRIRLELTGTRGSVTATETYNSTVILRGSY